MHAATTTTTRINNGQHHQHHTAMPMPRHNQLMETMEQQGREVWEWENHKGRTHLKPHTRRGQRARNRCVSSPSRYFFYLFFFYYYTEEYLQVDYAYTLTSPPRRVQQPENGRHIHLGTFQATSMHQITYETSSSISSTSASRRDTSQATGLHNRLKTAQRTVYSLGIFFLTFLYILSTNNVYRY